MKSSWKDIRVDGIAKIEKCVAEFNVWELNISPYAKFKIKVFEDTDSKFAGYSNLQVIDEAGNYNSAVGYGSTLEEALNDTIRCFVSMTVWKAPEKWMESDFLCSDSFDF